MKPQMSADERLNLAVAITETIADAEAQRKLVPMPGIAPNLDFEVGKDYYLWTVTHHFTGKFMGFNGYELVFNYAAWIPDGGRAKDAFATGAFNEVEPFPDTSRVMIGRGSIIQSIEIDYPLPRVQK